MPFPMILPKIVIGIMTSLTVGISVDQSRFQIGGRFNLRQLPEGSSFRGAEHGRLGLRVR